MQTSPCQASSNSGTPALDGMMAHLGSRVWGGRGLKPACWHAIVGIQRSRPFSQHLNFGATSTTDLDQSCQHAGTSRREHGAPSGQHLCLKQATPPALVPSCWHAAGSPPSVQPSGIVSPQGE